MGKYSSDSDSSNYSRKKKSRHRRSSSRSSSSSSRYSSRSKRSKKSKKHHRERSRDKYREGDERRRGGGKERKKKKKAKHHSRRSTSASSSRSGGSEKARGGREGRRREESPRKESGERSATELLAKLNQAVTQALGDTSTKLDNLFTANPVVREQALADINAPSFSQRQFISSTTQSLGEDEKPTVANLAAEGFVSFNTQLKEEPGSLLHPNLLIEEQSERTARWVKKLYQMRQRALAGR